MTTESWITAEDAQRRLNVRPQTLYAYVSRGRIAAVADPAHPRRSLYAANDVETLGRRRSGRSAAAVAARTIAFGDPVLESSIATIAEGRLFYRGRDAVGLAGRATLEEAAELLWNAPFAQPAKSDAPPAGATLKARAFAFLARRAGSDQPLFGRAEPAFAADSAVLLSGMVAAVANRRALFPLHRTLAAAWKLDARGVNTLRTALVLLADHELNASTFATRVAASTGASLAASALAGLSALTGPLHGGFAERVAMFVEEVGRSGSAKAAIRDRLARGDMLPGFGHPLYPAGDPRAVAIQGAIAMPPLHAAIVREAERQAGLAPNVDFALSAMGAALDLPADAPFAIFAVARLAGWIAHALEQRRTGTLIRPRARYVGPPPELSAPNRPR